MIRRIHIAALDRLRPAPVARALRDLLDVFLPRVCLGCDEELDGAEAHLCPLCAASVVAIGARGCRKCGAEPEPGLRRPRTCARCRGRRFAFTRTCAALRYGRAVRSAVLALKFARRLEAAEFLGIALLDAVREAGLDRRIDVVVPVPLHPWRRLIRGFDQAEVLARLVARGIERPVAAGAVRRRRLTARQARRAASDRGGAMEGAFAPGFGAWKVKDRRVLLVDDVMTSGATMDAAAQAVRRAGARIVFAGAAARG